MRRDRGSQLLQLIDQLMVTRDGFVGRQLEFLALQAIPARLEALPDVGHLQLAADPGIAGVDFTDQLAQVRFFADHVVFVGRISGQHDEQAASVVRDGCEHGTYALRVPGAFDLVPRERHLRVGTAQIEDSQQHGRHSHCQHQHTELLPQLQPT